VAGTHCRILELRQYTLRPGRRDELIELFDTELLEPQEAVGMHVLGQFRDADRPDRFVWFRGFPSLPARRDGLTRFYIDGDVWARHRDAANATMLDSDDVLLLRPTMDTEDLCSAVSPRPASVGSSPSGVYTATIYHLRRPFEEGVQHWLREIRPALQSCGAHVVGVLRTERGPNNFPRLPVRADVDVLVVVVRYASHDVRRACDAHRSALEAAADFARHEQAPREELVLEPTSRSALR
jgi:hypothetical protein